MHRPLFFTTAFILSFLTILISTTNVQARVSLPGIFSSNMVLQRNDHVKIWGNSTNKTVTVTTSWNNKKYKATSDDTGNWNVFVATPAAGGPYSITFNDGEKLILQNVLIGEVWVCSGQSNMDMPVKGFMNQPIVNSSDILLNSENDQIRLIKYERTVSRTPKPDNKSTSWQVSDAQSARDFSAVAFQFAQTLQQKLKVPVGVIMSTWGGTKIEAWMTENSLKSFPEIKVKPVSDTNKIAPNDPTVLFNGMINPFLGYGIKGVIWYQGESNRINANRYEDMMISMVNEWRALWNRDLSFYYVQIAPFKYADRPLAGALIREAQLKASKRIPNSGMAVTMDIGAENSIHPPDKTTVSKRLALQALANTYGIKGLSYASPEYKSMTIEKGVASISFDHADNGLSSFGKSLSSFEIAGEDKVFYPATAKIIGKGVVTVQSEKVKQPVAVRYAFKDWVIGDLYNIEGFPASSFRTDNWEIK